MTQIEMAQIGMTQMTKQIFFDRKQGTMFMDDPAAIADYCMREWPGECSHILRVADQVCRNSFLFDLKQDLERTWAPVEFPEYALSISAISGIGSSGIEQVPLFT